MRNFIRTGLLTAMLVGPVLLFVFLKSCGRNHFDIPYYHPIMSDNSVNITDGDTVYHQLKDLSISLDSSNQLNLELDANHYSLILRVDSTDKNHEEKLVIFLQRMASTFKGNNEISATVLQKAKSGLTFTSSFWNYKVAPSVEVYNGLLDALLFKNTGSLGNKVSSSANLVLIDKKGFYRGYYSIYEPKEVDRLFAEVKILLNQ